MKAGVWVYKNNREGNHIGLLSFVVWLVWITIAALTGCQDPARLSYTMQDVLAHNDYQKAEPFHHAYDYQVGIMEADLYDDNGVIKVAHDLSELDQNRDLETMYLMPLRQKLTEYGRIYKEKPASLALMLDIKNNPNQILEYILGLVKEYPDLLGTAHPALHLVISGHRPPQEIWSALPSSVLIDGRLSDHIPEALRPKVFMVSSSFSAVVPGAIDSSGLTTNQLQALQETIQKVHHQNLKIRFWGVPDNFNFWELQNDLGVDILGSDQLDELASHLNL